MGRRRHALRMLPQPGLSDPAIHATGGHGLLLPTHPAMPTGRPAFPRCKASLPQPHHICADTSTSFWASVKAMKYLEACADWRVNTSNCGRGWEGMAAAVVALLLPRSRGQPVGTHTSCMREADTAKEQHVMWQQWAAEQVQAG